MGPATMRNLEVTVPNPTYDTLCLAINIDPRNPADFMTLQPGASSGSFGITKLNAALRKSLVYINGVQVR